MFEMQDHVIVRQGVPMATVVEFKRDVGQAFGGLHKDAIQSSPGHRVDALPLQTVGLKRAGAVHRVHPPSANGQGDVSHLFRDPCAFQRFPAAVAQGEVDASSAVKRSFSRVGTSLVHDDLMTSVAEHAGPKAAHQSCTDDGHLTHGLGTGLGRGPQSGLGRLRCPR